jgi:hypothetical protein
MEHTSPLPAVLLFDIQGHMIIPGKEYRVFLSTPHMLFLRDRELK